MKRSTSAVAVILALSFGAAPAKASDPTDVSAYVLLAEQELRAKGLEVLAGNIGASAVGGRLLATRGLDAPDSLLAADKVRLRNRATCSELLTNDLRGGSCGTVGPLAVPTVPNLAAACGYPADPPACDPSRPVMLPKGRNRVLELEPGVYGDLKIAGGGPQHGQIVLTGGEYVFCSVRIARGGMLSAAGPVSVFVAGDAQFGNASETGPAVSSGLTARDIEFFVQGSVDFVRGATGMLQVCAPFSRLSIGNATHLTGRFIAQEIRAMGTVRGIPPDGTTTTTTPTTSTTSSTSTTLPQAVCGNGILEPGEECDGDDLGGAMCPDTSPNGSMPDGPTPTCTEECTLDFSTCPGGTTTTSSTSTSTSSSTSTVPTVTTTSSTSTTVETTSSTIAPTTTSSSTTSSTSTTLPQAVCGNGILEPGEECDGEDIGDAMCPDTSPGGSMPDGPLPTCTEECTLDFSTCPGGTTTTSSTTTSTSSTTTLPTVTTTSSSTSTSLATTTSTVATTTSTLATTTSTVATTSTTSTSSSTSTSTSVPVSTTSTSSSTTSSTSSTSTSTSSSTSSTSSTAPTTTTTSTSSSTTTSTSVPEEFVYTFTTAEAGGVCGAARDGGAGGTILKDLTCGGLNIGAGSATVPEGPTPANAATRFAATCSGPSCILGPINTGDPNSCSDIGCPFGTFLSIANGPLSTCVNNTFAMGASGSLDLATGDMVAGIPLSSEVTVTGNDAEPCPPCSGMPGAGTCNAAAANPGASCFGVNSEGDSYDCLPAGSTLPPFGVDLTPAATTDVTESAPDGIFCPNQGTAGCFAQPACDFIEASGMPAGAISPGVPHDIRLASIFCIPKTGNLLVDGAANLPGPGEVTLPAEGILTAP